jgi:hypothetical protein
VLPDLEGMPSNAVSIDGGNCRHVTRLTCLTSDADVHASIRRYTCRRILAGNSQQMSRSNIPENDLPIQESRFGSCRSGPNLTV